MRALCGQNSELTQCNINERRKHDLLIVNLLTLIWISFNKVKPGRVSNINLCTFGILGGNYQTCQWFVNLFFP